MLFFMPYLFARYFEANDKVIPALIKSLSSFVNSIRLTFEYLLVLISPFITTVISPITSFSAKY